MVTTPIDVGGNRKRVGTHEMGARESHPIWLDAGPNLAEGEEVEAGGGSVVLYQLPFWTPIAALNDPDLPGPPYLTQPINEPTRCEVVVAELQFTGTFILEWTFQTVLADGSTPPTPLARWTLELKIRCV